ncbi:MAG TPA: oligosaccharide flippase family protein [Pseudolabrys sp.]|jgi:O-antigen/teichoic acid export membrane protein
MALLRHSGIYFLARILTGGASFAIIAAYTRLLDPHAFGELALALAGVGFFSGLIVNGQMLAMVRYLPEHSAAARATTLWGVILPVVALCCVVLVAFLLAAPERWRVQLALCAGLLLATLLHQFQLAAAQGALRPARYALLGGLESVFDMALGIGLVRLGYGVPGALLGTMLGALVAVAINWRGWWISWKFFDPVLARQMLRFGLPLSLGALFGWLTEYGSRWFLAVFVGTDIAGLYAAGYDLQMNLLGVALAVMQLAGYPLVVSAWNERGTPGAQTQLRLLGAFLILIVLPEAVGIVMTGPLLANIFLGPDFRALTLSLLPILVSATLFKALMAYVAYGYVLVARTDLTLLSIAVAAAVNFVLNAILIPYYGPWGAAVASLIGFGAGFVVAAMKMGRLFPFPLPDAAVVTAGLIGIAVMALWLAPFNQATAWTSALYVIPVAVLIYFGSVFLVLHVAGRKPLELARGLWSEQSKRAAD